MRFQDIKQPPECEVSIAVDIIVMRTSILNQLTHEDKKTLGLIYEVGITHRTLN